VRAAPPVFKPLRPAPWANARPQAAQGRTASTPSRQPQRAEGDLDPTLATPAHPPRGDGPAMRRAFGAQRRDFGRTGATARCALLAAASLRPTRQSRLRHSPPHLDEKSLRRDRMVFFTSFLKTHFYYSFSVLEAMAIPSELVIDVTADSSSFDSFLDSIAASRGVTSLTARSCRHGALRRLLARLRNSPDFVAAIERLDLSSDCGPKVEVARVAELARLLHGFTRLTDLNLRGS
jgi:hypothetical protein